MRAIIPCAGYGTRMNMRPDQSKEMLTDPENRRPLIDYALLICQLFDLSPLIITRKEKMDLNRYVFNKAEIQMIEPQGEWPDTVRASQDHWHDENILILPDTRFSPINVIEEMRTWLNDPNCPDDYAIANHMVNDADKWGVLVGLSTQNAVLYEKPTHLPSYQCAWGLLGWKRAAGARLFSGENLIQLGHVASFRLTGFRDITR